MIDSERTSSPTARRDAAVRTMRAAYPVAIAMILVVSSFVATLVYSHFLLQRIDQRALTISENAIPGMEHLSTARGEMMRCVILANSYVDRPSYLRDGMRDDISLDHTRLLAELAAYRTLPTSAEESRLLRRIEVYIDLLDQSTREALDEADAGARESALNTLSESLQPLLLLTDETIERLRKLDELAVRTNAERILRARHNAMRVATLLGLLSLAIAVGTTGLVLYLLRTRARLIEEHGRLLADRATELEAFAGRVAHDLRDPLNATGLRIVSILRGQDLDPPLRQSLGKVSRQLERMRYVIDGLLDFARSGAKPTAGARADLAAILDDVVASDRPAAEAAQAELRVGSFSATWLACTPEALTSILANLLGNAIKYVREGTQIPHRICVRVSKRAGTARIEIEDNGPGLPPDSEQSIFEPFRRLRSTQPGIGLGLATVKRIVEAYHGRVGVTSDPGKGSTFWVELPCSDPPPAEAAVATSSDGAQR